MVSTVSLNFSRRDSAEMEAKTGKKIPSVACFWVFFCFLGVFFGCFRVFFWVLIFIILYLCTFLGIFLGGFEFILVFIVVTRQVYIIDVK